VRIAVVENRGHGGMLHYAFQLAEALGARGHAVDLVVPRRHELQRRAARDRAATTGGLTLREVLAPQPATEGPEPRGRLAYQLRRLLVAQAVARSAARVVREVGRSGRYDAAVLQWELPFPILTDATRLLLRARRRPAVGYVLHNVVPFNRKAGDRLHTGGGRTRRLLAGLLPRFDVVFVHGDRGLADYRATWPAADVNVIPHGDEGIFGPVLTAPAPEERVLFFGDWRKVKGLDVLMAAFDELLTRRPGACLTIAGAPAPADYDDGPLRDWAERRRSSVTVLPRYVPMEQVPGLFASARVVVLPYLAASQSGVAHLAMTFGRAVVASRVGALPEAVDDGVTGLVVEPGDPVALADALAAVLADPGLATRMGAAGRARVAEQSDWSTVAALVVAALARAVDRRAGRVPDVTGR
jgi:glycosyltransferase involved in cell wall biosynthesis